MRQKLVFHVKMCQKMVLKIEIFQFLSKNFETSQLLVIIEVKMGQKLGFQVQMCQKFIKDNYLLQFQVNILVLKEKMLVFKVEMSTNDTIAFTQLHWMMASYLSS